jgi:DNA polymerase-1
MGLVRQVIETLRLPMLEAAGFEADDIIATLATRAAAEGHDVLVVTGDRDSYQLVADPHVKVLYNKRGVSEYALYDEAGIAERCGVPPELYVQYAALRGDPSDNLPGVPGVGEKTAAKLITSYGGIDGIYEHLDAQTPKLRQNLATAEDQVRMNVLVMELLRDVPIEFDVDQLLTRDPWDPDEVKRLFDFLEFRSLLDRLFEAFGSVGVAASPAPPGEVLEAEVEVVEDPAELARRLHDLAAGPGPIAVAGATSGPHDTILDGLAVVAEPDLAGVLWFGVGALVVPEVAAAVQRLLAASGPGIVAHDVKPVMRGLLGHGISLDGLRLDTALAAYLLDPSGTTYPLAALLERHTTWRLPDDAAPPAGQLDFGETGVTRATVAARAALAVHHVAPRLATALEEDGVTRLNDEVEVPLVGVLARMEHLGVGVDRSALVALVSEMTAETERLAEQIQVDAGERFNVNSTKVLREVLFDRLGLSPQKKKKTGYSTDAATLEKLVGQHPIVETLLAYREVEKLRSTYGESLLAEVGPDGRIHATFNQTVARTGRLSSEHPNLHNIPVRTAVGRAFRRAFVPAQGCLLLVADYNQIELRCIAHLAQDPGLIEAFSTGTDVHRVTAARVFGVAPEAVTFEQRSKAKMVSYGLAYGMESYGLGQRLGIPTREAQGILDAYFEAFPSVRAYMDRTVTEARNRGYTETLFGRRRPIPELRSDNPRIRQAGERQAMNAGIQGLAADIFKVALVRVDRELSEHGLGSRLVLQVHDEVILEVPPEEKERATELVLDAMSGAFALGVPLEVNLSFGTTWADAKD